LAAVVDLGHKDAAVLIEQEEDTPLPYSQAVPAFQRALECLNPIFSHAFGCGLREAGIFCVALGVSPRSVTDLRAHPVARLESAGLARRLASKGVTRSG